MKQILDKSSNYKMDIVVVGTGYVGIVTGTCLAESGNRVICVDIDEEKIAMMEQLHHVTPNQSAVTLAELSCLNVTAFMVVYPSIYALIFVRKIEGQMSANERSWTCRGMRLW